MLSLVSLLLTSGNRGLSQPHPKTSEACQAIPALVICPAALSAARHSAHDITQSGTSQQFSLQYYLWCHLLSYGSKFGCSVDILLVADMGDIDQDGGLPMDKAVQDIFLQGWEVVGDLTTLAQTEGVVAVREKDGCELALVVQEVALVGVG